MPNPFPLCLLFFLFLCPCFAPGRIGLNTFMRRFMLPAPSILNPPLFLKIGGSFYLKLFWHVTYFHNITLSGTSANEIVTFNGKSDVVELLSLSPYSSCTSNCIAAIFYGRAF